MKRKHTGVWLAAALVLTLQLSAQVKFEVLHNFAAFGSAADGSIPFGPLLRDSKGDLYGVTTDGGTCSGSDYGCGTVFELSPQANGSWSEEILHTFAGGSGGAYPWGALVLGSTGNLYGTIQGYGSFAVGGVYSLAPEAAGWGYRLIYGDGAGPGLTSDNLGNLYGAIGSGQYFSYGAIGELSPGSDGWTYAQLYSFCPQYGCPDGYSPPAPPIFDSKGNLWGTTFEGGIGRPACADNEFGCGVIYAMTRNRDGTWTYHVVHRFASSPDDGQFPQAGLTLDPAGNFYGSTEDGGPHGNGIIFKFSVSGGQLKSDLLYDFPNCQQGCYPQGTLALDQQGNLYGMAQGGTNSCGGPSCGVVFRLAPQKNGGWKYNVLYNLNETSGGVFPFYGLILDDKGNLFGVTGNFGKYGGGTAFEITP